VIAALFAGGFFFLRLTEWSKGYLRVGWRSPPGPRGGIVALVVTA